MIPNLTVRPFTTDQYVLDKVFYSNHYKLKAFMKDGPVVMDVGAHCGFFTFVAASLGASKIYSFEPYLDNYRILLKNTEAFESNKVIPYQIGVYANNPTQDLAAPALKEGSYYDFANLTLKEKKDCSSLSVYLNLDFILKDIVREKVDILKINDGIDASDILATSSLENVVSVVYDDIEDEYTNSYMEKLGFINQKSFRTEEDKDLMFFSKEKLSKYYNIE